MTYTPIKARVKNIEEVIERESKDAVKAWVDWFDQEVSEEHQRSFWRACYHQLDWKDEHQVTLCGDQEYETQDNVIACEIMEKVPEPIMSILKRFYPPETST